MKKNRCLAFASLSAALLTVSSFAASPSAATDRAAALLRQQGSIELSQAGPHVSPGTFRVQVAAKLGRPDVALGESIWLYHHHRIEGSAAEGTLVVRFADGRVTSLSLATPAVVTALRNAVPNGARADALAKK